MSVEPDDHPGFTLGRFTREGERSVFASASTEPGGMAVAFLSAVDANGNFVVQTSGSPEWQKYEVFYYDAATGQVRLKEVPLSATASERTAPGKIETYDDGSGPKPWSAYMTGGHLLARNVTQFTATINAPERIVELSLAGQKKRPGNVTERASLSSLVHLRN